VQVESGRKADEVAREAGVSNHTIYAWKQKYGDVEVAEAQELRHLREENARLCLRPRPASTFPRAISPLMGGGAVFPVATSYPPEV